MDEPIWCRVRLQDVAHVVDGYELWKDGPWYHDVDWNLASTTLAGVLQKHARDGVLDDLAAQIDRLSRRISTVDIEGIAALIMEPITATGLQLTNGGHRLAAMLRQGVPSVPGMFLRGDIGVSVDRRDVYPVFGV
ncbi:hypothetical protein [Marmoricola sp. RAF53]|uniref:hypothetical protein n=1 Tax=Marmoricola sp. RAF53 TaxID=3233059 RepID=UPI003F9D1275